MQTARAAGTPVSRRRRSRGTRHASGSSSSSLRRSSSSRPSSEVRWAELWGTTATRAPSRVRQILQRARRVVGEERRRRTRLASVWHRRRRREGRAPMRQGVVSRPRGLLHLRGDRRGRHRVRPALASPVQRLATARPPPLPSLLLASDLSNSALVVRIQNLLTSLDTLTYFSAMISEEEWTVFIYCMLGYVATSSLSVPTWMRFLYLMKSFIRPASCHVSCLYGSLASGYALSLAIVTKMASACMCPVKDGPICLTNLRRLGGGQHPYSLQ